MHKHALTLHVDFATLDEQRTRYIGKRVEAAAALALLLRYNALIHVNSRVLAVAVVKCRDACVCARSIFVAQSGGRLCELGIDLDFVVQRGRDGVRFLSIGSATMLDVLLRKMLSSYTTHKSAGLASTTIRLEAADIGRAPRLLLGVGVVDLECHLSGGRHEWYAGVRVVGAKLTPGNSRSPGP